MNEFWKGEEILGRRFEIGAGEFLPPRGLPRAGTFDYRQGSLAKGRQVFEVVGACYLPARKSLRIDPAVALRQE